MKKLICTIFIAAIFFANAAAAATSAGTYVYELAVDIINPDAISDTKNMILGVEFTVVGGDFGDDWTVQVGDAVPAGGHWIFESYGTGYWNALYDDWDYLDPEYFPMASGVAMIVTSDVELDFGNLGFYDYGGADVNPDYFTTNGFVLSSASVPVPGSIFLMAGGLAALAGISRRK